MSHLTFPERLILGKLQPLPIENFIKYTDTTNGRDKLYRFVQYFARFLVAVLKVKAPTHTTIISSLENLKANLGVARKCKLIRIMCFKLLI
jgi:peroxin-11B